MFLDSGNQHYTDRSDDLLKSILSRYKDQLYNGNLISRINIISFSDGLIFRKISFEIVEILGLLRTILTGKYNLYTATKFGQSHTSLPNPITPFLLF